MIPKYSLSAQLTVVLKSIILWRTLLFTAAFYHIFTWSSPFPSDTEANLYLNGLSGESAGFFWILLVRAFNVVFSFSYAKFAFVLIGLCSAGIVYSIFRRVAGESVAIITALIICGNSFLFNLWHRTQPEIVVLFLFLGSVYFFVRFSSYWHLDLKRSANITVAAIFCLSLAMINTDYSATSFLPAMQLMIFLIFYRVYSLHFASISTVVMFFLLFTLQLLVAPSYFGLVYGALITGATPESATSLFSALNATYLDGYASPVWEKIHSNLDFLNLSTASLRSRELASLLVVTLVSVILFAIKMMRLFNRNHDRVELQALCYGSHIPLVLVFLVASGVSTFFEVCLSGTSITYLAYAVVSSILLFASIYAFFVFSARGSIEATVGGVKLVELIYKPVAVVACCVIFSLSLANSMFYIVPYRGSNYPTIYDAMEQFWKGSACSRVAYGVPVLNAALNSGQKIPPKTLGELFHDIQMGRTLDEGCIVFPLIARDGVYQFAAQFQLRSEVEELLREQYSQVAHLILPFYQKDAAYPFTDAKESMVGKNTYHHAHGHPLYGFGGMQDVIIYRPLHRDP